MRRCIIVVIILIVNLNEQREYHYGCEVDARGGRTVMRRGLPQAWKHDGVRHPCIYGHGHGDQADYSGEGCAPDLYNLQDNGSDNLHRGRCVHADDLQGLLGHLLLLQQQYRPLLRRSAREWVSALVPVRPPPGRRTVSSKPKPGNKPLPKPGNKPLHPFPFAVDGRERDMVRRISRADVHIRVQHPPRHLCRKPAPWADDFSRLLGVSEYSTPMQWPVDRRRIARLGFRVRPRAVRDHEWVRRGSFQPLLRT